MAIRKRIWNKIKRKLRTTQRGTEKPIPKPSPSPVQQQTLVPPVRPEMSVQVPKESRVQAVVEHPKAPSIPKIGIEADLRTEWESDYVSSDAPVRNAHHRPMAEESGEGYEVIVRSPTGEDLRFECEPEEFVLDAADRAGLELPFSCRSGGCLVCTGKIVDGTVQMAEQYVLEEEQVAQGYILLCCTAPTSDVQIISHQEEYVD